MTWMQKTTYLTFYQQYPTVLEESDKLVNNNCNKKLFVKMLSRMFALLLHTKVNIAEKIKRIIKITIETTLKIWQEPRQ